MHRHFGGTIRRLVRSLAFVVALLFDVSFKMNMSIQHQTNLIDNFEGQRQNCSTKVLLKVKPARIFPRDISYIGETALSLLKSDIAFVDSWCSSLGRFCQPRSVLLFASTGGFEINSCIYTSKFRDVSKS